MLWSGKQGLGCPIINNQPEWDSKATRAKVYFPNVLPFLPAYKNIDWWRRLLQEPFQVSYDKIKESVKSSTTPSLYCRALFVCSYKLKVEQFHHVVAKWGYQDGDSKEIIEWVKMIVSSDPSHFVFIRYICITTRTGIGRCIEDKTPAFGLLRSFSRSLYDSLSLL